jgi:hypothetical protein
LSEFGDTIGDCDGARLDEYLEVVKEWHTVIEVAFMGI